MEKTLNPSKMETNELPEEVRKKIDNAYRETLVTRPRGFTAVGFRYFKEGAEFGYRLALQSKEEQLKAKDKWQAKSNAFIDKLGQELASKEEEITKLWGLLKSISDYYSDREKPKEISATLFTIDSRSTQSTDKPN